MLKERGKRKIKFCPRINWYLPNIHHHNPKGAGKDFCPTSPVLMSFLKPYYLLITFTLIKRKKRSLHFKRLFLLFDFGFFFPKQAALGSSHHSPDYHSLTNIFGFVPPLWLKQRQFTMQYKPGRYTIPFPHPISQGDKKKKKLDFSSPSLWPSPQFS